MKKVFISLIVMLLPMMAVGQSNTTGIVLYENDYTGIEDFTGWYQFDDSQTDGIVEVDPDGVAITVGVQTGQLWQPQVMVVPDGSFNLEEDFNYRVIITAKFPTAGTLQINMGSWSANDQNTFPVEASDDFQTIECDFEGWSVNVEGAHLMFQCGDFKGTTILKNIKIIEYIPSNFDIWSIAGDEKLLEEDWNVTSTHNYMRTIDGINYTLTKKDIMLSKGTYHFKAYKYNTTESYPSGNASLVIEEDAVYTVKFTFNANTKSISATATKTGGLFYNYIAKGKVAEVKQLSTNAKGSIVIPEKVTYEGEEYTVTKILYNAFYGCSGITSVSIPNSVTSIGLYAFQNCSKLSSITLPSNITSIGDYVFYGCTGLTSFTIPTSVTSIGNYAFSGCSGLKNVTIHTNVSYIGNGAFQNCTGLTSFTIPNNIKNVSSSILQGCSKLTSVTIPNSVTDIGSYAFSGCSKLTSITIPNNVNSIGGSAFQNCSSLTSITIPNSITAISSSVFSGCSGLTSITIPNSVTDIGSYAFQNCSSLTSITIPNNLLSIGYYAFAGCSKLASVTIPNSVTNIGGSAFSGCSKLASVTIGSGIISVNSLAFANCMDLANVYCMAGNVPNTITDAFEGSYIEYATLHVPAASLSNYSNAEPWKNFASKVAIDGGEIPQTQKCAKPTITFNDGKLTFSCATQGVEYISEITAPAMTKKYDNEISLGSTYTVTVYATKVGYINSDKASIEIQANSGIKGDLTEDGKVDVADHVELSNIIMGK